ncbi:MAG: toll/interleukin-1 receptor domain-containing protein, partial [Cyanobacteria bacterium P01_E01_bin.34]
MSPEKKYHVFIAYASPDRVYAKSLYEILRENYEVFVDWECLLPGDKWDVTLPKAQSSSLITIVLISNNVDESYYQKEEIASAIEYSRTSSTHRVIPIYIDN